MARDHRPSVPGVTALPETNGTTDSVATGQAPTRPRGLVDRIADLAQRPYAYDFRQAVRLLENYFAQLPRLGTAARTSAEAVRLGQQPYLSFAPASLQSFRAASPQGPAYLATYVLGMHGPNSPIPRHLTEYAIDRQRHRHDRTLTGFLDMFHHRLLCHFYRAWADSEPTVADDRSHEPGFRHFVASLCGLAGESFRHRDAMPDTLKWYFADHLLAAAKNPFRLASMLTAALHVPVQVEEFVPGWLPVPQSASLVLGRARLGSQAVLGQRVWSASHQFRLLLGPLSREQFDELLPMGRRFATIGAVVRNLLGDEFDWEAQLILRREQRPAFRLPKRGGTDGPRLGWTSWLATGLPNKDDSQVRVRPRTQYSNIPTKMDI